MYVPDKFRVPDDDIRHLLRHGGLAELVTAGPAGLDATPMPFGYEPDDDDGWGSLIGHMARVNPQWRDADGTPGLVIVRGADHYVTPRWRPSNALQHKAVPTWDYEVLNVHGTIRVHDDATWVESQVRRLAEHHEPRHDSNWSLDEVPAPHAAAQLRAIVGIELVIDAVVGKLKMGQDRPHPDQVSIARQLRAQGRDDSAAAVDRGLAIGEDRRHAREVRVAQVQRFRAEEGR